jgi:hypothetical protein
MPPGPTTYHVTLNVTATMTPTLVRKSRKTLALTATTTTTVARKVRRPLPALGAAGTATLARKARKVTAVTVTGTPTLTRKARKVASVTVTGTPSLTRRARKTTPVTVTTTPALVRRVARTLPGVTAVAAPTLAKKAKHNLFLPALASVPWHDAGVLPDDLGFSESDIVYASSNYHVFQTFTSNPGTVRIYKAAAFTDITSATPTYLSGTNTNLHATTASVDNGDGTVTFTTTTLAPATAAGVYAQINGHPAYSENGNWVIITRIDNSHFLAPGSTSGGTGGTVRTALSAQYPTAALEAGTWNVWAVNASGVTTRYTTADPITASSVWAVGQSNAFGTGANLLIDASVRKHPVSGLWYAVGFLGGDDQPLTLLRAATHTTATWTNLGNIFAAGEPSWATYARVDPNLAFTPDGRAWVTFTGYDDVPAPGGAALTLVEVDLSTGRAFGEAMHLPETEPDLDGLGPKPLSDLVYVAASGERDRIFGFGMHLAYLEMSPQREGGLEVTGTPALVRKGRKALSATVTTAPTVRRKSRKALLATATTTPSVAKKARRTLPAVTTAGSPALVKKGRKPLSATATASTTLTRRARKVLLATAAASPSVVRRTRKSVTVTSTAAPSVAKKTGRTVSSSVLALPTLVPALPGTSVVMQPMGVWGPI